MIIKFVPHFWPQLFAELQIKIIFFTQIWTNHRASCTQSVLLLDICTRKLQNCIYPLKPFLGVSPRFLEIFRPRWMTHWEEPWRIWSQLSSTSRSFKWFLTGVCCYSDKYCSECHQRTHCSIAAKQYNNKSS